jgi:Xaa-Pro aminopeptidase
MFEEQRIKNLRKLMAENELDASLIEKSENIEYYTGFPRSFGSFLVITFDTVFIQVPSMEIERAKKYHFDTIEITPVKKAVDNLIDFLNNNRLKKIGIEENNLKISVYKKIYDKFGLISADYFHESLRSIKSQNELKRIKKACKIADIGINASLEAIEAGKSEYEIVAIGEYAMTSIGSDEAPAPRIVASGPNSSFPHMWPSNRKLKKGDLVILDYTARNDGYCSDISRTTVVGKSNSKTKEMFDVVYEVQNEIVEMLHDGITCKEVDMAARELIKKHNYEKFCFTHTTGHGIGLEVHESPRIHFSENVGLIEGNVVTIEPAIYIPGFGGVRIEDTVVIKSDCCERLTVCNRNTI